LVAEGGEHGQREEDNERRWGCARGLMPERRGLWREAKHGDGRVARGDDAELAHARCLMKRWRPEDGRLRPR
jgi:hypothetical protein